MATIRADAANSPRNNMALWWTAVLVRSAVSDVEGGGEGRRRFHQARTIYGKYLAAKREHTGTSGDDGAL